ncbi:ABC transporter ATP-binding protein [Aestuariibacter halophilus]|uniref:ABC transporter ATP-binding protein n=1 Tax=Fluctibacter halophilus TaxID=226011 RepID=A0ABS8G9V3_9ALTE|nr:ABC transporter ATP-binding protein [Aestuariibacter halophilus]MCC2617278.1 ABC transporter ATP-binding protein [Aestuariibacter halophilus]
MQRHDSAAVAVDRLVVRYPNTQRPVLDIPHWQVEHGQHVFLYGPSGSGKSTLLSVLAGILPASEGEVTVLGQPLGELSSRQCDRFRARHIGMVFQQHNLIPYLSVRDNVLLAAQFADQSRTETLSMLTHLCERMQLPAELQERPAMTLSVGQRQRVAIIRALINRPSLLIADEPTSALDEENRERFMGLLMETLQQQGASMVFVSHDHQLAGHFSQQLDLRTLNQVEYDHVD